MVLPKTNLSSSFFPVGIHTLIIILRALSLLLLFLAHTNSLSFKFTSFNPNTPNIKYENDSFASNGVIQLTRNQQDSSLTGSVGRASYSLPVTLWDSSSTIREVTDFTTHFSFIIKQVDTSSFGDGLSFFIAPFDSSVPDNSIGGYLGLVSPQSFNLTSENQFVAVEFDSFQNPWDPSSDHVGINVNSIVSVSNVTWQSSIKNGSKANAWITYDSSNKNLSVFLTYADNPVFVTNSSLWHIIDLSTVLPQRVRVGFSASTGKSIEIHNILSWDFNSTLEDTTSSAPLPGSNDSPSTQPLNKRVKKLKSKARLVGGIISGVSVLTIGLVLIGLSWWRRRSSDENDNVGFDEDDDFENGTGCRRFTYRELTRATNNFAEEGKLGEGGFGGVFVGLLTDPSREIAVKKISKGSKQGKKEYVSEVKIISRLRHRNLVQLLGWCHDHGELLLVYEFMPNGSLDSHLYGGKKVALSWEVRYKIAHGLASALLYLHEEWEQCVVHRDVKSSNVMLDSNFNAKLGDFGLARLVDHNLGSQTTVLAGTLGYLAPECFTTGKASKESDVYSFGVVALEIACGRRPVESMEEPNKVRMVEWVWNLYGKHLILEAVDTRLGGEFDMQQIKSLMLVGMWCCHPDYNLRPSIRQVINVLTSEAPLPNLPSNYPVPIYFSPPMNMDILSYTSSYGVTGSTNTTSSSSQSVSSGSAPLLSQEPNI